MTAPSIVTSRHCPLVGAGDVQISLFSLWMVCRKKRKFFSNSGSKVFCGLKSLCEGCPTGAAFDKGGEVPIPAGISIVEPPEIAPVSISKEKTEMDTKKTHQQKIPSGNWDLSNMPDINVDALSPSDLRSYWKTPVIPTGRKGTCPNCLRHDMLQSTFGLCGACKNATKGKTGVEMLNALADKARRLNPDKWVVKEIIPSTLEKIPEPVSPASPEKSVDTVHDVTDYIELAKQIGKLVQEKQEAYGDSFGKSGKVMRIFYPDGILPKQYNDALCVVRIVDKLFRIATDRDALGESPYVDISGYGLLGTAAQKIESNTYKK